jgi:hypothetical protein
MNGRYYDVQIERVQAYTVRVLADNADDAVERASQYSTALHGVEELYKVEYPQSVRMSVPQEPDNKRS